MLAAALLRAARALGVVADAPESPKAPDSSASSSPSVRASLMSGKSGDESGADGESVNPDPRIEALSGRSSPSRGSSGGEGDANTLPAVDVDGAGAHWALSLLAVPGVAARFEELHGRANVAFSQAVQDLSTESLARLCDVAWSKVLPRAGASFPRARRGDAELRKDCPRLGAFATELGLAFDVLEGIDFTSDVAKQLLDLLNDEEGGEPTFDFGGGDDDGRWEPRPSRAQTAQSFMSAAQMRLRDDFCGLGASAYVLSEPGALCCSCQKSPPAVLCSCVSSGTRLCSLCDYRVHAQRLCPRYALLRVLDSGGGSVLCLSKLPPDKFLPDGETHCSLDELFHRRALSSSMTRAIAHAINDSNSHSLSSPTPTCARDARVRRRRGWQTLRRPPVSPGASQRGGDTQGCEDLSPPLWCVAFFHTRARNSLTHLPSLQAPTRRSPPSLSCVCAAGA
jgi:hypothetical protein